MSDIRDSQIPRLTVVEADAEIRDSQLVRLSVVEVAQDVRDSQIVRLVVADIPDTSDDLCNSKNEPILFSSLASSEDDRQWHAVVAVPDPTGYYGGWKDDRLLAVSPIRRALAGPSLDYQISTFSATYADDDYAIRQLLTTNPSRYYSRLEIEAYLISPEARRSNMAATLIATGFVDSDPVFDTQDASMTVQLSCRDSLGVAMGWTLAGQTKLPRRVLNNTTLPGIVQAAVGTAAWIPWGNLSTNLTPPDGFAPPLPSGLAARGSFQNGGDPHWICGYAPMDQTVAPVTGVVLTAAAGGDCPARDYAAQVFPVTADNRVGDPVDYIPGTTTLTISAGPNQSVQVDWVASPDAAFYYVVLFENYFGWRPIEILTTAATTCTFDHAADMPDPGTGLATGAVAVPDTPTTQYSARSKNGPIVSQWHEDLDPVNYPKQIGLTYTLPNGVVRPLRVYWTPATADAYQVKKQGFGPVTPILFDMPVTNLESGLVYFDDDFNDSDALPSTTSSDRAAGRIKAKYTRDVVLPDGNTWHELFWAGSPCSGVSDWYYDPGGNDPSVVEVNMGDGTDFLFPKTGSAWDAMFSTRYRDITGSDGVTRRFMLGYARGSKGDLLASGSSIITLNIGGTTANADCSGGVVTDLHDAAYLFVTQYVLASGTSEGYTSGDYPAAPKQGFGSLDMVNKDSFDAVKAMRAAEISGGLTVAGVTGANGEQVDVSEEYKRWMQSGDMRWGANKDWQIVCCAIDSSLSPAFVTTRVTDEFDIQKRTFKPLPRFDELQNVFVYRNSRNLISDGWLVDNQSYVNQDSIDNWRVRKGGEDLEFHYIEDSSVVAHVLGKHTVRRANAPMYADFTGGICWLSEDYDVGSYLKLKHWRGVANGGWTSEVLWVLEHAFDPMTKQTTLHCLDVTGLIASNGGLLEGVMSLDLGGSWYASPVIPSNLETINAYEYRDRRFPWADFPLGTTVTARLYGVVPSGVTMTLQIYDPDTSSIVATDPTPFTWNGSASYPFSESDFGLHTFQIPSASVALRYRLRAVVTGGSGAAVGFHGQLEPSLP